MSKNIEQASSEGLQSNEGNISRVMEPTSLHMDQMVENEIGLY